MGQPGRLAPLGWNERLLKVVAQDRWLLDSSQGVSTRMGDGGACADSPKERGSLGDVNRELGLLPDSLCLRPVLCDSRQVSVLSGIIVMITPNYLLFRFCKDQMR